MGANGISWKPWIWSGIFSNTLKVAEAWNIKGYAIKEPNEVRPKMIQAMKERKPPIALKEIRTHHADKKRQGGKYQNG